MSSSPPSMSPAPASSPEVTLPLLHAPSPAPLPLFLPPPPAVPPVALSQPPPVNSILSPTVSPPPKPPPLAAPPPEASLVVPPVNSPLPAEPIKSPAVSPLILPSPVAPTSSPLLPVVSPSPPPVPHPQVSLSPPSPKWSPSRLPVPNPHPQISPSAITRPPPWSPVPPATRTSPPPTSELPPSAPPVSFLVPPPLSLPLANGNLPVSSKETHIPTWLIFGCVVGGLLLMFVLGLFCLCCRGGKWRKHSTPSSMRKDSTKDLFWQESGLEPASHVVAVKTQSSLHPPSVGGRYSASLDVGFRNMLPPPPYYRTMGFTYDELVLATNDFSVDNLIGQGGFGFVHKGVLPSGKEIAVKKLKEGSSQGDSEFQAEVEIIGRVHHKHLVSLEGYCITSDEKLLVYEFVPNKTLEFHLHGKHSVLGKDQTVMDWPTRLKIAIGSAKGLAYLHEDCNPAIIHRDVKAANILLDHNFEGKVSDFGLAKSFYNGSTNITHITTRVMGTFGYLAPEYASTGKLTEKSDVYSFGVMLLEIITGRPPISDTDSLLKNGIVDWARPLMNQALENGNFDSLVDQQLEGEYNATEMASMVTCAAACVRHSAKLRPRMSQIVRALEGDIPANDLVEGTTCRQNTWYSSSGSSNYDIYQRMDDSKNANIASASQQNGISVYSGTTSEYGLQISRTSSDISTR